MLLKIVALGLGYHKAAEHMLSVPEAHHKNKTYLTPSVANCSLSEPPGAGTQVTREKMRA